MTKIKICIKNLSIKDILNRSNRIFLKIKSGNKSILSQKHQIDKKHFVQFEDMISIDQKLKRKHQMNLRFSFRIEKDNGIDFVRYGSFNLHNLYYNKHGTNCYHIERNLEKCMEMPIVQFDIMFLEYQKMESLGNEMDSSIPNFYSQSELSETQYQNELSSQSMPCFNNNHNLVSSNKRISKSCNYSQESLHASFLSTTGGKFSISEEKFLDLESQIDNLLSTVVNDEASK